MKKNFIITTISLFLIFGCDDYLDVLPDNRQTITNLEDISELLVSAYSEGSCFFLEWKTDNVTVIRDNTLPIWMTENYQYVPAESSDGQDSPTFFWETYYTAISHANQALKSLDDISGGDADFRNALRGEALICRAYNHFMLVNVFSQHYNEANKGELGIPYITEPETSLKANYDRGTLEETYDLIEKDLLQGIDLISDEYYVGTGKYHFTKKAANAFASRFYLFTGQYQKCVEYSNTILGNGIINTTYVRDMEAVFTGTSSPQMADQFNDINEAYNLFVVRKESFADRFYLGYRADTNIFNGVMGINIQQSFDQRYILFNYGTEARSQPKYNELFQFTTATTGFPYLVVTELRGEEVIFNRMESYVMQNKLQEALDDYNVLATLRYDNKGQLSLEDIVDYFGGNYQEAMFEFVLLERRKEFMNESLRWFDIKRHNLEVTHIDINDDEFVLQANDLRKAIQIPQKATINGIQANPR